MAMLHNRCGASLLSSRLGHAPQLTRTFIAPKYWFPCPCLVIRIRRGTSTERSAKQFCQVLLDQSREPLRLCGFFGKKATPTSIGGSNKHKDEGPKTRGLSDSDSASPTLYSQAMLWRISPARSRHPPPAGFVSPARPLLTKTRTTRDGSSALFVEPFQNMPDRLDLVVQIAAWCVVLLGF